MSYEAHDMKAEEKAYREDMDQERENARVSMEYLVRLEFAQANGGLAGYDPYADCDY